MPRSSGIVCLLLGVFLLLKFKRFSFLFLSPPAKGSGTDPPLRRLPEGQPHRERLLWSRVPEHADELGEQLILSFGFGLSWTSTK